MKKLGAMVVIAALLCASSVFALGTFDWDVTCRVSTNADEAGIPVGSYFYEYAWEVIQNDAGLNGEPSTPNQALLEITGYPGVIQFNAYGDSEAPDETDYPATPALSSLGTFTENWLNGLGWTAFTGAYWLKTPGTVVTVSTDEYIRWQHFTMESTLGGNPGLGFYTSFLADAPPMPREWQIENAHLDGGTVCGPSPEPVSAVLLLLGLPVAAAFRKRRQ